MTDESSLGFDRLGSPGNTTAGPLREARRHTGRIIG